MKRFTLFVSLALCLTKCYTPRQLSSKIIDPVLNEPKISEEQREIDEIFMLLAYSLVYKDWQPAYVPREKRRGYNIGAVLVNKENKVVAFELNAINSTDNSTQHGEVRVITKFLEKERCFNLDGYSIYTTLEPCVMCAGMITMTDIDRAIFGQRDIQFSKAFERLSMDTTPIGGFPPYPRKVETYVSQLDFALDLDVAYQEFLQNDDEKVLAKFLASEQAKAIYKSSYAHFLEYTVRYPENEPIYAQAITFFYENSN